MEAERFNELRTRIVAQLCIENMTVYELRSVLGENIDDLCEVIASMDHAGEIRIAKCLSSGRSVMRGNNDRGESGVIWMLAQGQTNGA